MLNNEKKKKSMFFQELLVRLYDSHYLFIWLFHNVFFLQCSYNDRPLISQAWTCVDDQTVALFQIACKTMSHSAASFFSSVKMCLMETQVRKSSHVMNGLRRSFLHKDTEYTCIFSSWAAGENRKYNLFGYFFHEGENRGLFRRRDHHRHLWIVIQPRPSLKWGMYKMLLLWYFLRTNAQRW